MILQNYFYVSEPILASELPLFTFTSKTNAISVPVEITAGQILITFWDTNVSPVKFLFAHQLNVCRMVMPRSTLPCLSFWSA